MGYEVFRRSTNKPGSPQVSIVPDGRIAVNAAAARILSGASVASVLLLWDKATRRLALKATGKGDKDGYAVSMGPKGHAASLRATLFTCYIGWKASKRIGLPATWNEKEKMLEVTLPQKHLGEGNG